MERIFLPTYEIKVITKLKNYNSMERYRNSSGNSGVYGYEIGNDYIRVQFKGNSKMYGYSYLGKAGRAHVDKMKSLASNGSGLNAYIKTYVNNLYD